MTKEEAIKILKTDGCFGCYVEKDNPYNCNDGGCEIREAYYMAIEALEQTRWIPCSERLPEEIHLYPSSKEYSDIVLATIVNHEDDDNIFVDMVWSYDGNWRLVCPNDGDSDVPEWCEIIAWMPLPEAWKGEEEANE